MHDLPTHQEELDRKALDTLQDLMVRHQEGRLTNAQLNTGLTTLFSAVAGLVSPDVNQLLSQARPPLDSSYQERVILRHPSTYSLMLVERDFDAATVVIHSHLAQPEKTTIIRKDFSHEIHGGIKAAEFLDKFLAKAQATGFEKV